jgi:ABC-type transporter Mla subunit MlaD
MNVQRTDLYVGAFVLATVAVVVAALVATSGWGVRHFDLYILTDNARDLAVDTKIYLQGLEVGRVADIAPRPSAQAGRLEFVVRASMIERFRDGTPLRLLRGTDAEVETALLGGATLLLAVHDSLAHPGVGPDTLVPGDTIRMHRRTPAMEAFGALAEDLKGTIQEALEATTATLNAARRLSDSLAVATGTARGFVAGLRPGTERSLKELAANLERVRRLIDTNDVRAGILVAQLDSTLVQTRRLMASADSATRFLTAFGAESRPEIRQILVNLRQLSEQVQYVMEQLGRRPMRVITGVRIPDSLTVAGRDSARRRGDSLRTSSRDTLQPGPPR